MGVRSGWVQLGMTVRVIAVAVLLDAASGGWDTVGWLPPVAIAVVSAVAWVVRRRSDRAA